MFTSMWSAKGGVGLSVSAALVALTAACREGAAVLVDLCGDQSAILGIAEPAGPGVFDWLASQADSTDSLRRLLTMTGSGVWLLAPGSGTEWDPERVATLMDALASFEETVVIDCGVRTPAGPSACGQDQQRAELVERLCAAGDSVLVTTACYLALRRAVRILGHEADAAGAMAPSLGTERLYNGSARDCRLVVVAEPGRALDGADVAAVVQLPVVAELERDPAIARRIDAGQLLHRPPRTLLKALEPLA